VIGAAAGLHIMQADFGFMVILGLFALFGIIINNAIVLVDRCEIERSEAEKRAHDEGKTRDDADVEQVAEAVVQAGMRRFRPILMTTITTILGLLPLIIGQDVLFYGLASAIAFGLVFALAITLGAVPVLYAWFFGAQSASSKSGK
jgi:multidrug efflux pump subunit AcrB